MQRLKWVSILALVGGLSLMMMGHVDSRHITVQSGDATKQQAILQAQAKKLAAGPLQPLMQAIEANKESIIREWISIAEIPAPSRKEAKRRRVIAAKWKAAGLRVSTDQIGNLIGVLPGTEGNKHKQIVIMAHLDTVFDATMSHKVRRVGTKLHGLGIGDDTSGLINLVILARYFRKFGLRFKRDIVFVASVQEEIGLRGATHFVKQRKDKTAMIISVDGGFGGLSYGALGIEWYRIAFRGKGNHTLSSMGKPSTTHAVAQAITSIYQLRVPRTPMTKRTWYNIGRMGAGRVVNAQALESWFSIDLRSMDATELKRLKRAVFGIVQTVAYKVGVQAHITSLQTLPAAQIKGAKHSKLVQSTKAILHVLGRKKVWLSPTGASDYCAGIAVGIPGINIGTSRGGGAHTPKEWIDTKYMPKGIQQTALLLSMMAELQPPTPTTPKRK
jgi:acetylornithine deacetylase/succinyl-diaminopimelate desuccinylase-like protein